MKLIILSGVAGVGKSTYIKEHLQDAIVVASDDIGAKLGKTKGNDAEVFERLYNEVREHMANKTGTIVVDATMLTRRKRLTLLSQTRPGKFGYEVEVIQLHKPLEVIQKQNASRPTEKRVPEETVKQMYLSMQPAKVGLDCDTYTIVSPGVEAYRSEISKGYNNPHQSAYHAESLREHVELTMKHASDQYGASSDIYEIAQYHDLGKSVSRTRVDHGDLVNKFTQRTIGGIDTYVGHANVSAMYYKIAKQENANDDIMDSILHHMDAHQSEDLTKNKAIRRSDVSEHAIRLMGQFRDIDDMSRVVDVDFQTTFNRMKDLSKRVDSYKHGLSDDNLLVQLLAKDDVMLSMNAEDVAKPLFTFKYIHAGVDFSDDLLRNARALTLDMDGEIITIGFEKFFNYMQLENEFYTFYDDEFKDTYARVRGDEQYKVFEKLDGTFISLGLQGDKFVASTTSSTMTDFSKNAVEYFSNLEHADELKEYMRNENICLMFEYTSPTNQIVVPYEKEEYTLIGARRKDITDPSVIYLTSDVVNPLGLKVVEPKIMTLDELLDYQRNDKTSEGFVALNEHNRLIKFKTDYWFEKSKLKGELFFGDTYTERKLDTILTAIRNDTIDDLVAYDNQRVAEFHPVTTFKNAWDNQIRKYKEEAVRYDDTPRNEISHLDIDTYLKTAIFYRRDGRRFEDIINNEGTSKKFARFIRDQIEQERATNDLVDTINIDDVISDDKLIL